jgi:multidrug resistance efflux pump
VFALDNSTLHAPQDGCVDALLVRAGDVIAAGAVVQDAPDVCVVERAILQGRGR